MPAVSSAVAGTPAAAPGQIAAATTCAHCGFPTGGPDERFCCPGCETVFGLLQAGDLTRYYELRTDAAPVPARDHARIDRTWLAPLLAELEAAGGVHRVALDVQGLRCAACVWLIETLFRRRSLGLSAELNPALGRLVLLVRPGFDLTGFVDEIERFGYQLGPARRDAAPAASNGLLYRLGVCVALSMNAMLFAFALYAGLDAGPLYPVFHWLVFVLASAVVVVGGLPFLRTAWQGLRGGVLHVDLPIALGICLAYGASLVAFLTGHESSSYFDTIAVFVTLMLLGRFLQERVLERNRRALLDDAGLEGLRARRLTGGQVDLVPCLDVHAGDRLLVAAGELLCVDARPAPSTPGARRSPWWPRATSPAGRWWSSCARRACARPGTCASRPSGSASPASTWAPCWPSPR
jgi:Cu2+-exporting ATPase